MKVQPLLCFLAFACLNAGCSWVDYTYRNMFESPLRALDDCCAQHRFRTWAGLTWKHVLKSNPDQTFSADYACGFLDGYVDYLDAGGNGEPPAMPPDRYLCSKYETPEGVNAIHDWFAGFRHGARMARDSGLRELVELPIGLPPRSSDNVASSNATPPTAQLPARSEQTPPATAPAMPVAAPPTPVEELPQPRTLPNSTPKLLPPVQPAQPAQLGFEETDR